MPEWGSRLHRKEKKDRNNGKEQTEEHEGLGILKTVIIDRKNSPSVHEGELSESGLFSRSCRIRHCRRSSITAG